MRNVRIDLHEAYNFGSMMIIKAIKISGKKYHLINILLLSNLIILFNALLIKSQQDFVLEADLCVLRFTWSYEFVRINNPRPSGIDLVNPNISEHT